MIIAERRDPHKTENSLFNHKNHALNRNKGRMSGQLRIRIRFKKHVSEWFDFLLVSWNEMNDILK
ncbi:MAG: hypothetical protein EAX96_18360 [Candidatus Lokiarchaeota archaeon]|nr:hypothetical protein [Candidatus Lokiarchaeota archaeon]